MNLPIQQLKEIFSSKQTFVFTTHINPDADALGSEVALARFLSDRGKTVHIYNESATPDNLLFLNEIYSITQYQPKKHSQTIIDSECFIVLDTNALKRFPSLNDAFHQSKAYKVLIDHHLEHENFADINIIDTQTPATCELLYTILYAMEEKAITLPIANALYAGIMTDTGSFRFPQTDAATHRIVADLLERGVQPYDIYQKIYESGEINKLQLLGKALTNITLYHDGKVAIMSLPRSIFQETHTVESDVDNFTQYVLSINGVLLGMVIMELDNGVKVSLRSKGNISVNELAKRFGGGGHKNAAGARIHNTTLNEIIPLFIETAKQFL